MTEDVADLTRVHLRRLDLTQGTLERNDARLGRLERDVHEIKTDLITVNT